MSSFTFDFGGRRIAITSTPIPADDPANARRNRTARWLGALLILAVLVGAAAWLLRDDWFVYQRQRALEAQWAQTSALFDESRFAQIEPGTFMMGAETTDDEQPIHRVTLTRGFELGRYEVTQAQWEAVMGSNPSYFKACGGDCPVEQVSWQAVQTFLRILNGVDARYTYRLPTEAEWEYAARAGSTTAYAFGDDPAELPAYAWYGVNSQCHIRPVGRKQPNAWGLYDMHGNLWEWTHDWDGDYPAGPVTDPSGPASGEYRTNRGGGWSNDPQFLTSSYRGSYRPGYSSNGLGFRLARTSR